MAHITICSKSSTLIIFPPNICRREGSTCSLILQAQNRNTEGLTCPSQPIQKREMNPDYTGSTFSPRKFCANPQAQSKFSVLHATGWAQRSANLQPPWGAVQREVPSYPAKRNMLTWWEAFTLSRAGSMTQHWGFHKLCVNTSSGRANANHISVDFFPIQRDLGSQPWENSWKRGTETKSKNLRVTFEDTKTGNITFNMGIDTEEKASKQQNRKTGKEEIYFGPNPTNLMQ